jgi:hypothetical protein
MRIGIFGTGRVARALGLAWAARGHQVCLGGRDPERARALSAELGTQVRGGTVREAAEFGEVLLLAIPWTATRATLNVAAGALAGKILIDCTNPLRDSDFTEMADLAGFPSAAETIASWVPEARVVKAFNAVSTAAMLAPRFGDHDACLPYCGDDEPAKSVVARLVADSGFDPLDIGGLREAHLLEAMALLVIRLAFRRGLGPDIAWKLLRR